VVVRCSWTSGGLLVVFLLGQRSEQSVVWINVYWCLTCYRLHPMQDQTVRGHMERWFTAHGTVRTSLRRRSGSLSVRSGSSGSISVRSGSAVDQLPEQTDMHILNHLNDGTMPEDEAPTDNADCNHIVLNPMVRHESFL
jgi:hypothetical protein